MLCVVNATRTLPARRFTLTGALHMEGHIKPGENDCACLRIGHHFLKQGPNVLSLG